MPFPSGLDGSHWLVEEQGPRVTEEVLKHWKGDTVPGVVGSDQPRS